jgi:hypothetical protein
MAAARGGANGSCCSRTRMEVQTAEQLENGVERGFEAPMESMGGSVPARDRSVHDRVPQLSFSGAGAGAFSTDQLTALTLK